MTLQVHETKCGWIEGFSLSGSAHCIGLGGVEKKRDRAEWLTAVSFDWLVWLKGKLVGGALNTAFLSILLTEAIQENTAKRNQLRQIKESLNSKSQ